MAALNAKSVTKLDSGRQEPCTAELVVNFSDVAGNSGNAIKGIWLPEGAVLDKVGVVVITPFNSATSDTIALAFESDSSAILAATSIAAAGRTAASETNLGVMRSAPDYIDYTWTGVGAVPTAGPIAIRATYTLAGKAQFNHGKDGVPPGLS